MLRHFENPKRNNALKTKSVHENFKLNKVYLFHKLKCVGVGDLTENDPYVFLKLIIGLFWQ